MKIMTKGFSLIELMISVAIIGILSAVAIPFLQDYLSTAESATIEASTESIRLFEQDYHMTNGKYGGGTWSSAGTETLTTAIGWEPEKKGSHPYSYTVAAGACGDLVDCYKIEVKENGSLVYDWDSDTGVGTWH